MKKKTALLITFCFLLLPAEAQDDGFSTFRERMLNNYNSFRNEVLEEYARYLDQVWIDLDNFKKHEKKSGLKPEEAPIMDSLSEPTFDPVTRMKVTSHRKVESIAMLEDELIGETPSAVPAPASAPSDSALVPPTPVSDTPVSTSVTTTSASGMVDFSLYGMPFFIPKVNGLGLLGTGNRSQVVTYWKSLLNANTGMSIEALQNACTTYNLGGWCTLKAVEAFAGQCVLPGDVTACRTLTHFLMVGLGYDVRIAVCGKDVALLVPYEETVFSAPYFDLNGRCYYVYPSDAVSSQGAIQTCPVPSSKKFKHKFDLVISSGFRLPEDPQPYYVNYSDLYLQGTVNRNLINLMKDYPVTLLPCYASSNPDETIRHNILEQLRQQLDGLDQLTAANELLHFVQKAFVYKADVDQFSIEKTFFAEEMFYYPYCDCEDRAILYSYLIHNLLDLDVVLLEYPGHVCTAVAFAEPLKGSATHITYKDRTWFICDPTYIGSDIGMSMPRYASLTPQVSTWY